MRSGFRTAFSIEMSEQNALGKAAEERESRVSEVSFSEQYPKYRGAREIPWEDGGKGEKHPGRGVKKNLKPCAYKH